MCFGCSGKVLPFGKTLPQRSPESQHIEKCICQESFFNIYMTNTLLFFPFSVCLRLHSNQGVKKKLSQPSDKLHVL